jgi:hypothetical protein
MGDCRGGNMYVTCCFQQLGLIKPNPEMLCLEHVGKQPATHADMDEATELSLYLKVGPPQTMAFMQISVAINSSRQRSAYVDYTFIRTAFEE